MVSVRAVSTPGVHSCWCDNSTRHTAERYIAQDPAACGDVTAHRPSLTCCVCVCVCVCVSRAVVVGCVSPCVVSVSFCLFFCTAHHQLCRASKYRQAPCCHGDRCRTCSVRHHVSSSAGRGLSVCFFARSLHEHRSCDSSGPRSHHVRHTPCGTHDEWCLLRGGGGGGGGAFNAQARRPVPAAFASCASVWHVHVFSPHQVEPPSFCFVVWCRM